MGLITCTKCKKIYDYEKYGGICPKCARYNSESTAAEEHQELHNKYDGGYSHTVQDDHHSYHQKYDTNQTPHQESNGKSKMDVRTKRILIIIIFVFTINFLLPVLFGLISTFVFFGK